MSNVLSEEKKQQVIALGKLGWPLRRIEQATGVRRETAGAYLKAAGIAVRPPGSWGRRAPAKPANEVTPDSGADLTLARLANSKPANEVTPDFGQQIRPLAGNQGHAAGTCEPYRELIEQGLERGRNAKAIWQDLVSDHGFPSSYQAVKRFVRKHHGSHLPQPVGIILTAAGEEAQVDYGTGPMVRDAQSGKYRRTRLFVMTLGYSRKSVRLLIWRSSSRVWAELHEKAFRRLGGWQNLRSFDFRVQKRFRETGHTEVLFRCRSISEMSNEIVFHNLEQTCPDNSTRGLCQCFRVRDVFAVLVSRNHPELA